MDKPRPPSSHLLGRPLAILPYALNALDDTLNAGPAGLKPLAEVAPTSTRLGRVAVIAMHGPVLTGIPDWLREYVTVCDPYQIAAAVKAAADDKDVSGIVLDINSPGGVVEGVDLAAEAVRDATAQKPVIACVRDMMASAAFWIGCGATTIITGRTSMVGSIGTFMRWTDWSGAFEQAGMQVQVYRSGDLKAPGQAGEAKNKFVDQTYSTLVEDTNAVFLRGVSLGRGLSVKQVEDRWASGRVWVGEQAIAAGVADQLGTLQDAITLALGPKPSSGSRAAALPPPDGGKEGRKMPPEILALLGLSAEATPEQIKAAMQQREQSAAAEARSSVLTALGLSEEAGQPSADLADFAARAADGSAYREALLDQLKARTIALQGNDEAGLQAAERAAKVWAKADIADLKAETERLQAQIDAALPAGRVAHNKDAANVTSKKAKPAAAYGLR